MTSPQTIEKPRTKARLYKAEFIQADGETFMSPNTFPTAQKAAEDGQRIAKTLNASKFSRVVEFVEK